MLRGIHTARRTAQQSSYCLHALHRRTALHGAARRRTARSVNAAPILLGFDYGVYAPYGAVRRRTAPYGAVQRRTARSVNAPLVAVVVAFH